MLFHGPGEELARLLIEHVGNRISARPAALAHQDPAWLIMSAVASDDPVMLGVWRCYREHRNVTAVLVMGGGGHVL